MKTTAALGTATRTVGKLFFALTLLFVAIAVGFGGTALFVYHQLGTAPAPAKNTSSGVAERKAAARPSQSATETDSQTRRVAALPADQPRYTYADNNGGQPSTPARRVSTASTIPAPLENSAPAPNASDRGASLDDPESRYIVDSRTGRVVGIDGSAGARREQDDEHVRQESTPPRAVAVQTPAPEVRVAAPVLEDGKPVFHGDVSVATTASTSGSQYKPVRKALPVTDGDEEEAQPRSFNVAEYVVSDRERPVLRAQPVMPVGTRTAKAVRVYRLPDGSQIVSAD